MVFALRHNSYMVLVHENDVKSCSRKRQIWMVMA